MTNKINNKLDNFIKMCGEFCEFKGKKQKISIEVEKIKWNKPAQKK